jgi:hypothetical protein
MTIQQQFEALLDGATDAGENVFPINADEGVQPPYVVYHRISADEENVLSGVSGLTNTRMQVDVYARTYGQAVAIAAQIDALMASWAVQNVGLIAQDLYEAEVKLFRISADYSIWHPT